MFNRLNKFQGALALALYSQGTLGQSFGNNTSSSNSSSSAVLSTSSTSSSISSIITESGSSATEIASSVTSSFGASSVTSESLSSSDGTVYLPSTTISGDLTVTGNVIATEAVEIAKGGKLTLVDGVKYGFSAALTIHGDLFVTKTEPTYEGSLFDISGETFEVSGSFNAQETAAESASIYSFTPGLFENSGNISLNLSKLKKGEVTFSPFSNSGAFSFSNTILNGGSVSGLERRDADEGSINNGEINLDNGSTYVIVEAVSGNGTVNIISGNLFLHYPNLFTGQTVIFKGEGILAVDPTETNTTPIPIVGYTGKNQIAITADVNGISYDSTTGVLTAVQGNRAFSFAVGTGFSDSGFSVSEGLFAGAYAYYLNYDGVIAPSTSQTLVSATSVTSSLTLSESVSTTYVASSIASGESVSASFASGTLNSTVISSSVSDTVTSSAIPAFTSGTVSSSVSSKLTSGSALYTTTVASGNVTSTLVVACSETTDASGNIYTITTTIPCSYTTATITSCDDNGCHIVPAPTAVTETITSCDENGCHIYKPSSTASPKTVTVSSASYTAVTVTHCDENGCTVKTVTSEAPKRTSATVGTSSASTISESGSLVTESTVSGTSTGIIIQSEDNGAGLRTNGLSALIGLLVFAFLN